MPILGVIASGVSGHLSFPSDFESIQTINITNNSTTVADFTSIPATYRNLYLRSQMSATVGGAEAWVSFNGDTTAGNYSRQVMYNTGSGAGVSFAQNSQAAGRSWLYSPDTNTNYPYSFPVYNNYIIDYAQTNKYKSSWQDGYQGIDASYGAILGGSFTWANTASAINRITLTMQTGAFAQYSQLALFGLK
jgi:hypothetical protein